MKLAFVMNLWAMRFPANPEKLFDDPRGLTGSEISFIMFAIELAKLGHEITLFSNFTHHANVHGCEFSTMDDYHLRTKENWDVALAWIDPMPLMSLNNSTKKIFNQQVNDFGYCKDWEKFIDIITSPSQTHKNYLKQFSNFDPNKWVVLPNGCDPNLYNFNNPRTNKMIYASSPDRGLHHVLEAYPNIKKAIPDVELHIYYNFKSIYEYLKEADHEMAYRIRYCNYAINKLKKYGVIHHQAVSRHEMTKAMSESKILIYPCQPISFTEGFSVTTLEAAVSGCLPIIAGADALPEIYEKYVPMVPAPYSKHKSEYLDLVVRAFKDEEFYNSSRNKARQMGNLYNWEKLTKEVLVPLLKG